VREIDAFKREFPGVALREAHPEVCFWALNSQMACTAARPDRLLGLGHGEKDQAGVPMEIMYSE